MTPNHKKRTLLALLALIIFLTLTVLSILLLFYGAGGLLPLLAILVSLAGGGLSLYVLRVYHKQGYPWNLAALAIALGCLGCILISFGALAFGLALADENPAVYNYQITVTGLENYTGGPVTDILLPLPVREGEPVFSDEDLDGRQFGIWRTLLAETKQGKMLVFQTTEQNLSDISASFGSPKEHFFLINDITQESFSPVLEDSPAGYTRWAFGGHKDLKTFNTQIRLDEGITPENTSAGPIVISLWITAGGGRFHGVTGEKYRVKVCEDIPSGVRGMIPVKAQVARFGDAGIEPLTQGQ